MNGVFIFSFYKVFVFISIGLFVNYINFLLIFIFLYVILLCF